MGGKRAASLHLPVRNLTASGELVRNTPPEEEPQPQREVGLGPLLLLVGAEPRSVHPAPAKQTDSVHTLVRPLVPASQSTIHSTPVRFVTTRGHGRQSRWAKQCVTPGRGVCTGGPPSGSAESRRRRAPDSTRHVMSFAREWMGVEPTMASSSLPINGFEDRGAHRDSTTPIYLNITSAWPGSQERSAWPSAEASSAICDRAISTASLVSSRVKILG